MDYERHFGLKRNPFRQEPDPDFYYPGPGSENALNEIVAALRAGEGLLLLTGSPGTGRTMLIRMLLGRLKGEFLPVAVFNPRLTTGELARFLTRSLNLPRTFTGEDDPEPLNQLRESFATAPGSTPVILVDEAQDLASEVKTGLMDLVSLKARPNRPRLVLVGRPELAESIMDQVWTESATRVTRVDIRPLSPTDTAAYVQYRLRVAGGGANIFTPGALRRLDRAAAGRPRRINLIAERALMAAYLDGQPLVDTPQMTKALASLASEMKPEPEPEPETKPVKSQMPPPPRKWLRWLGLGLVAAGLLTWAGWWLFLPFMRTGPKRPNASRPQTGFSKGLSNESGVPRVPVAVEPQPRVTSPPKLGPPESTVPAPGTEALPGPPSGPPAPEKPGTPKTNGSALPVQVLHLPTGNPTLILDRATGQGRIWTAPNQTTKSDGRIKWSGAWEPGLYFLGKSPGRKSFIFAYPPPGSEPAPPSPEILAQLVKETPAELLPVLCLTDTATHPAAGRPRPGEIKDLVAAWAAAWREKDLTRFVDFHADSFTSYSAGGQRKVTYTKDQLRRAKKEVFNRAGTASLILSEPTCLLDPRDPNLAAAIFEQKYATAGYRDDGWVVLFFKLSGEGQNASWKIVAKLWMGKHIQ